jgi:tetraprenyl-beta-curcumene synthase
MDRLVREAWALLLVGAVYWLRLQPLARRELASWERRASVIPDAALRRCALGKLADEALNPEAATLFAVLAPGSERRRVAVFIVAYQVLYDYLDAVNEMPGWTPLQTGLQLHRALTVALEPGGELTDIYQRRRCCGDGAYVEALVDACRASLGELSPDARAALCIAGVRCAVAQSLNHAFRAQSDETLIAWSTGETPAGSEYEWWELAAAGISCLAVHVLAVRAADADATACELRRVDRAYFPSVCALSALLDSLADYYQDAGSENHSFAAHYFDPDHAARRLVAIVTEAITLLGALPHAARHKVILVGICAYYLSCSSVLAGFPLPAREALLDNLGWLAKPMLAVMRARRRVRSRGAERHEPAAYVGSASARRGGGSAANMPSIKSASRVAAAIIKSCPRLCPTAGANGAGNPETRRR